MQLDVVNSKNEKVGASTSRRGVRRARERRPRSGSRWCARTPAERRGTHATKNRAHVSGSGKKPWRQKGTGRARVGEIRNPLWRKGGTVFGPQPRSYDYQLPKKVERGALRAALAQKLKDGQVIVVDALAAGEIKTKAAAAMLKRLGVTGKAVLIDVALDDKLRAVGAEHAGRRRCVASGRVTARDVVERRPRGRDQSARREAAGGAGDDMKLTDVIRRPLITEKTSILREDGRTIVFQVAPGANKIEIKRAVEQLLGAKVASIRTSIAHGKIKRQGRFAGQRPDWKKAYVTLREGQKMPEFLEGA